MSKNVQTCDLSRAIDYYLARLRAAGARGVDAYQKTLRNNSGNAKQVVNFLSEAVTTLMFLGHGDVLMDDNPDLFVTLRAETFYAEVKHFNRKEQDDLDEEAERNAPELELVSIGETVAREGKTSAKGVHGNALQICLDGRCRAGGLAGSPDGGDHRSWSPAA